MTVAEVKGDREESWYNFQEQNHMVIFCVRVNQKFFENESACNKEGFSLAVE